MVRQRWDRPRVENESGPIRVAQSDEAEFSCRINDKVFRDTTQVGRCKAGPHHEFDYKVAVAHTP